MFHKAKLSLGLSPKTWAMMMTLKNIAVGLCLIAGGSLWMANNKVWDTFKTYFACGLFIGILSFIAAAVLILALVKGSERLVLLYILLEFIVLLPIWVFAFMNNLDPGPTILFILVFVICSSFWIGLYNVFTFYLVLHEYNNETVQAGVREYRSSLAGIQTDSFPDKAVDTTTV